MPEVPAALTKTSPEDLRDLLIAGHISAVGEPPPYNRLGVAWAQCMLEVDRGNAIWNFNVGNLKCFKACQENPANLFALVPTGPKEYPIFRAYVGPVEGCASYWRLLASDRYAPALPLFDAGKPYDAMITMGECGYFEAPPVAYANAVTAIFAEYRSHWADPSPPRSWGDENAGLIVAGAVLVGIGTAAYIFTR